MIELKQVCSRCARSRVITDRSAAGSGDWTTNVLGEPGWDLCPQCKVIGVQWIQAGGPQT